jgi:hypothetical protein
MSTLASSPKYAGIARTYAEFAIWITPVLLVANLLILIHLTTHQASSNSPQEPDQVITQADKLYGIMRDYGEELQMVASLAQYPDDATKQAGKTAVKRVTVNIEIARLALLQLDERRDRESMLQFLTAVCGSGPTTGNCATLEPPTFSHVEPGSIQGSQYIPGKETRYANTSRLESLHDDFVVLLTAMLKDAK